MIKRLNNKGISTAEVLVCFVLIVLISMSLYSIVETFKNKQQIESFKEKVITYKNLLTKEINNDLIKIGLNSNPIISANKVEFHLKNGVNKCLVVDQTVHNPNIYDDRDDEDYIVKDSCGDACAGEEKFRIGYGVCGSDVVYYPLPDLGFSFNDDNEKIYDLRISKFNASTSDGILSIDIWFYHPELGSKYGINLVSPINSSL